MLPFLIFVSFSWFFFFFFFFFLNNMPNKVKIGKFGKKLNVFAQYGMEPKNQQKWERATSN